MRIFTIDVFTEKPFQAIRPESAYRNMRSRNNYSDHSQRNQLTGTYSSIILSGNTQFLYWVDYQAGIYKTNYYPAWKQK